MTGLFLLSEAQMARIDPEAAPLLTGHGLPLSQ